MVLSRKDNGAARSGIAGAISVCASLRFRILDLHAFSHGSARGCAHSVVEGSRRGESRRLGVDRTPVASSAVRVQPVARASVSVKQAAVTQCPTLTDRWKQESRLITQPRIHSFGTTFKPRHIRAFSQRILDTALRSGCLADLLSQRVRHQRDDHEPDGEGSSDQFQAGDGNLLHCKLLFMVCRVLRHRAGVNAERDELSMGRFRSPARSGGKEKIEFFE
jgi:hypothetical protein